MSHHHFNYEQAGSVIGLFIGFAASLFKNTLLFISNVSQPEGLLFRVVEDCILAIPTAAIGAVVGFYVTKLIRKWHDKFFN